MGTNQNHDRTDTLVDELKTLLRLIDELPGPSDEEIRQARQRRASARGRRAAARKVVGYRP